MSKLAIGLYCQSLERDQKKGQPLGAGWVAMYLSIVGRYFGPRWVASGWWLKNKHRGWAPVWPNQSQNDWNQTKPGHTWTWGIEQT